jgi:hypothetical protein
MQLVDDGGIDRVQLYTINPAISSLSDLTSNSADSANKSSARELVNAFTHGTRAVGARAILKCG